jgi:hypothetical protein
MFREMWRRARSRRRGLLVFSLVVVAYGVERVGRTWFDLFGELGISR